jgi:hypothetical protein
MPTGKINDNGIGWMIVVEITREGNSTLQQTFWSFSEGFLTIGYSSFL